MRGNSGVAGEVRVVGVPKFHSCGNCTMPLTNINSDWMSNASSGLRIILHCIILLPTYMCIVSRHTVHVSQVFSLLFCIL